MYHFFLGHPIENTPVILCSSHHFFSDQTLRWRARRQLYCFNLYNLSYLFSGLVLLHRFLQQLRHVIQEELGGELVGIAVVRVVAAHGDSWAASVELQIPGKEKIRKAQTWRRDSSSLLIQWSEVLKHLVRFPLLYSLTKYFLPLPLLQLCFRFLTHFKISNLDVLGLHPPHQTTILTNRSSPPPSPCWRSHWKITENFTRMFHPDLFADISNRSLLNSDLNRLRLAQLGLNQQ